MPRLKNRNKQVPGGMRFYDPVLRWASPNWASFDTICAGLRSARMANPGLTKSKGLNTDPNAIAEEVDLYIATECEARGHLDYITGASGGGAAPFTQASSLPPVSQPSRLRNAVAGGETLVEWIASGAEAVAQPLANHRAEVCSRCPLNGKGGWEKWFTIPVSNAIRAALRHKGEFKLSTPFDDQLGVCEACDCPMTLKVWVPLDKFLSKMPQAAKDSLHVDCWIRKESA